jgi:CheY-like chemotaxis protein
MTVRHRALVAAQPAAWTVLRAMLEGTIDLIPVHSRADAFQALEHDARAVDVILATIAFDDSRMVEFLQAIKRDPTTRRIPFLCMRVLPGVLSDGLVDRMRDVCKQCEAADLVDVANLPRDEAKIVLGAAVMSCVEAGSAR